MGTARGKKRARCNSFPADVDPSGDVTPMEPASTPNPEFETAAAEAARGREQQFFDASVHGADIEAMPPRDHHPFDSQFEDAILAAAGALEGRAVLDLGCGVGDLSLRLAERGARVTALDLSPASIDVAHRRSERFHPGAPTEFLVGSAEETGLASASFDLVVGKWVLHHLELERAAAEIHRLLKPGAVGIFVETSGLNPALRFARRRLAGLGPISRYGTPDERPIERSDIDLLRSIFGNCTVDFPNFVLLRLIDRHVLRWRWPTVGQRLRAADSAFERRSAHLRSSSYYLRIKLVREL